MSVSIQYHDVSRETWDRQQSLVQRNRDVLMNYLDHLLWWNEKVNLVSRNTNRSQIWQHIVHSLLPLSLNLLSSNLPILDAGTGGGLPGLPLAITESSSDSNRKYFLNDINFKKITAVHQIAESLNLGNVQTRRGSFDKLAWDNPFIFISKHSFKIPSLLEFFQNQLHCRFIILYKGSDFRDEVEDLNTSLNIDAYRLDDRHSKSFYRDKYILQIRREP